MSNLSYIDYKGKKILYVDYTRCKTTEDMLRVLEEVRKEYENTTHMFISINDFRGTYGSTEFMKRRASLTPLVMITSVSSTLIL